MLTMRPQVARRATCRRANSVIRSAGKSVNDQLPARWFGREGGTRIRPQLDKRIPARLTRWQKRVGAPRGRVVHQYVDRAAEALGRIEQRRSGGRVSEIRLICLRTSADVAHTSKDLVRRIRLLPPVNIGART